LPLQSNTAGETEALNQSSSSSASLAIGVDFHDAPIGLNPKPCRESIPILLGEEGAKERLRSCRGAETFPENLAGDFRVLKREPVHSHTALRAHIGFH
jgi:hypothetical protein